MAHPILSALPELIQAGILNEETANRIRAHYDQQSDTPSQNRLLIAFGVLGAILVGLGIILIVAHNWDDLSRSTKTILSFLPLLVGQFACGYTLLKQSDSVAWREGASAFLFFTVGASIALISQVYNIPGNLTGFLLTWMLLCLPLVYLMRSSIVSLLYLAGITYFAGEAGYWGRPVTESRMYWVLLLLMLPHYYQLIRHTPRSNFTTFHNWLVPLSVISVLGTLSVGHEGWMFPAYFSLFGAFYLLGSMPFFTRQKLRNNGYLVTGSLGMISIFLMLSFSWFWEDWASNEHTIELITSHEILAIVILTLAAAGLLLLQIRDKPLKEWNPISFSFIVFLIVFLIGMSAPTLAQVLTNLVVFTFAILTIRRGAISNHLGILNYGLLIITALVICRFFDTDMSFVLRGILFVVVGTGFFLTNYWMIKRRKTLNT